MPEKVRNPIKNTWEISQSCNFSKNYFRLACHIKKIVLLLPDTTMIEIFDNTNFFMGFVEINIVKLFLLFKIY